MDLIEAARKLSRDVMAVPLEGAAILRKGFGPIGYVYNPLDYAWPLHQAFLEKYGAGRPSVVLVGMNPGPWGMGQTGVPFGDPGTVKEWLGLSGAVSQPARVHPARPVKGLESMRREESGTTLYGWARARFGTPEEFFSRFYIVNYCPLLLFDSDGKNVTPSDFRKGSPELAQLFAACDAHLATVLAQLHPEFVVGIGRFAAERAQAAVAAAGIPAKVGCITHPSPQTRGHWGPGGWSGVVEAELGRLGALEPVSAP